MKNNKRKQNASGSAARRFPEAKRKIALAAVCVLLAASVVFCFTTAFSRIGGANGKATENETYKGIITMWHLDMFEGGVGSRAEFLLGRAGAFEKKFPGVLVMVVTHTPESAAERYAAGDRPDLVSYGYGFEPEFLAPLEIEARFVHGEYDGKVYALAWCRGGYAVLGNREIPESGALANAVISQGEFTAPTAAAALSGYTLVSPSVKPPADAYYDFITGKADYLIGTQRDVNRTLSRGTEVAVKPLGGYNDLYQYVSVTSADARKKYYACRFVEYLLGGEAQARLDKIGMLSALSPVPHENAALTLMQSVSGARGLSVFTPRAVYEDLRAASRLACEGDEAALARLKELTEAT